MGWHGPIGNRSQQEPAGENAELQHWRPSNWSYGCISIWRINKEYIDSSNKVVFVVVVADCHGKFDRSRQATCFWSHGALFSFLISVESQRLDRLSFLSLRFLICRLLSGWLPDTLLPTIICFNGWDVVSTRILQRTEAFVQCPFLWFTCSSLRLWMVHSSVFQFSTGLDHYLLYWQQSDQRLAALNSLKYSVWSSRGAGLVLAYDGGLIFLPMLRNVIRIIRPKITWLFPADENIWFHRQVAYSMAFWTVVHTTAHYVNFINVERTR